MDKVKIIKELGKLRSSIEIKSYDDIIKDETIYKCIAVIEYLDRQERTGTYIDDGSGKLHSNYKPNLGDYDGMMVEKREDRVIYVKCCIECPHCKHFTVWCCGAASNRTIHTHANPKTEIPEWCPLDKA